MLLQSAADALLGLVLLMGLLFYNPLVADNYNKAVAVRYACRHRVHATMCAHIAMMRPWQCYAAPHTDTSSHARARGSTDAVAMLWHVCCAEASATSLTPHTCLACLMCAGVHSGTTLQCRSGCGGHLNLPNSAASAHPDPYGQAPQGGLHARTQGA